MVSTSNQKQPNSPSARTERAALFISTKLLDAAGTLSRTAGYVLVRWAGFEELEPTETPEEDSEGNFNNKPGEPCGCPACTGRRVLFGAEVMN